MIWNKLLYLQKLKAKYDESKENENCKLNLLYFIFQQFPNIYEIYAGIFFIARTKYREK